MKKVLVSIAFCLLTVATYAQSVSLGGGFTDRNAVTFATGTVGIPFIFKQEVKMTPYLTYTTYPMQRLEKYNKPYYMDSWKAGFDAEFRYVYFKYSRNMSTKSYQQRRLDLGKRYTESEPIWIDANRVEVGVKFTFHTFTID